MTQTSQQPGKPRQKRRNDFILGQTIGRGAFGEVIEVEDKETHIKYAMKILSKSYIIREQKMNYVLIERDAMTRLNHPNICKLMLTFQDPTSLYYVIELAQNGDLQKVLDNLYTIDISQAKILLGQVLLALAHMHKRKIIHRDLKPENILLDGSNRVKITDFGTAKIFKQDEPFHCERGSFVGSADYVSPETIKETTLGPSSDLWSFGCLIYALLVGYSPYHADSNYLTFLNIEKNLFTLPSFLPDEAKDLISKILVSDPDKRLGANCQDSHYQPIREHPFFAGIDWNNLPFTPIPSFQPFKPANDAHEAEEQKMMEDPSKLILDPKENVIMEGKVTLMCPQNEFDDDEEDADDVLYEMKPIYMILIDTPRIVLTNQKRTEIEIEIPLSPSLHIEKIEPNKLEIGIYQLLIDENCIDQWITEIKKEMQRV